MIFPVFVCTITLMPTPRRKRLGRPPKGSDEVRGIRFDMRLEQSEKEAFREAANLAGLDLSAWVRERLRAVARQELEVAGYPVAFLKKGNAPIMDAPMSKDKRPAGAQKRAKKPQDYPCAWLL